MYWCEGGKDVRAGLQFINSDPILIATFLKYFREAFNLDEAKFRALIHLHDYHDPRKQLAYWSEITQIPEAQYHKPYIKPHSGVQKRPNYPGCVSVRYLDSTLGKTMQMIYSELGQKI